MVLTACTAEGPASEPGAPSPRTPAAVPTSAPPSSVDPRCKDVTTIAARGDVANLRELRSPCLSPPDSSTAKQAILAAAGSGELRAVQVLLDWDISADVRDRHGSTLAHYAVSSQQDGLEDQEGTRLRIVKLLAAAGLDPAVATSDSGSPVLSNAAGAGYDVIATYLLDRGADVNQTDDQGVSALIVAAQTGSTQVVETLLAAGADPSMRNEYGQTALEVAQQFKKQQVAKLLERATRKQQGPR